VFTFRAGALPCLIHHYLVCVIIGFVIGWVIGWVARGDENRRYHTRRQVADKAVAPLPPARQTVVGWIPRGRPRIRFRARLRRRARLVSDLKWVSQDVWNEAEQGAGPSGTLVEAPSFRSCFASSHFCSIQPRARAAWQWDATSRLEGRDHSEVK